MERQTNNHPDKIRTVSMHFSFRELVTAHDFRGALQSLQLPATLDYQKGLWFVGTDSRALKHASVLIQFLYEPDRRRRNALAKLASNGTHAETGRY